MKRQEKEQSSGAESVLVSYLDPSQVLRLTSATKQEALETLVQHLENMHGKTILQEISAAVFERESLMSTGIGLGVAVPHVRLKGIKKLTLVVGVCETPLEDYESLDGKAVRLIFLIVGNSKQHHEYIKLLAALSGCIKNEMLRNQLTCEVTAEQFCELMTEGAS